jgi:hypothetical protein
VIARRRVTSPSSPGVPLLSKFQRWLIADLQRCGELQLAEEEIRGERPGLKSARLPRDRCGAGVLPALIAMKEKSEVRMRAGRVCHLEAESRSLLCWRMPCLPDGILRTCSMAEVACGEITGREQQLRIPRRTGTAKRRLACDRGVTAIAPQPVGRRSQQQPARFGAVPSNAAGGRTKVLSR